MSDNGSMYKFTIVHRMNTRSCSYSKKSILAVLEKLQLEYVQSGILLTVQVPTLELRRELEYGLQNVDRGVAYQIEKI